MDTVARLATPVAKALGIRRLALGAGIVFAAAAAVAAPSNALLPGPKGALPTLLSAAVLAAVFAVGYVRPLHALYGLIALVVLEGAIRKWAINDITVFLAKDFLALGIYAAVLPRLGREELRRPWWLVAPLGGLTALVLVSILLTPSVSQAVIGVRSYLVLIPMLWVAPVLVTTRGRAYALAGLVLGLSAASGLLAVVQALSGASVLNKLVSGALAGLITVKGISYVRPSGTFMQVGVLAAFLFFGTLVAFALVLIERRGRWLYAALAGFGLITWGVVYSSARSLLGSVVVAYLLLAAALLWRRRILTALAVPVAFALSLVVLFGAVPWVQKEGVAIVQSVQRSSWKWVTIPRQKTGHSRKTTERSVRLRVPPETARGLDQRIRTAGAIFSVGGIDEGGHVTEVVIQPRVGALTTSQPTPTVLAVDDSGRLVRVGVGHPDAGTAGGFLGRAADFNSAGGEVGLWGSRIRPQLELIAHQHLVGHGTGTMTLGSGYADNKPTVLQGESMYTKLAWELGWPGLALFLWFIGATLVLAGQGLRRAEGWQRLPALVGFGAALLLPVWYILTFALDFPIVALLFWTFAGCAVAYGSASSSAKRAPIASQDR